MDSLASFLDYAKNKRSFEGPAYFQAAFSHFENDWQQLVFANGSFEIKSFLCYNSLAVNWYFDWVEKDNLCT